MATVPGVLQIRHGVAEALNLHSAHLDIEGEVGQVHGTGRLDGQPHASQYFPGVDDAEKLILRGGLMEQCNLLIDKECVRNPNELDILGTNNQLVQVTFSVKRQPFIWRVKSCPINYKIL